MSKNVKNWHVYSVMLTQDEDEDEELLITSSHYDTIKEFHAHLSQKIWTKKISRFFPTLPLRLARDAKIARRFKYDSDEDIAWELRLIDRIQWRRKAAGCRLIYLPAFGSRFNARYSVIVIPEAKQGDRVTMICSIARATQVMRPDRTRCR